MNARLYIQTSVSIILAIRAGLKDARAGNPPFIWALIFHAGKRGDLLRAGWKDIAKLFAAALTIDVVYQIIELHMVYPGEAVIVATLLAVVPYVLVRPIATRLFASAKKAP